MADGTELLGMGGRQPRKGGTFSGAEEWEENAGRSSYILSADRRWRLSQLYWG